MSEDGHANSAAKTEFTGSATPSLSKPATWAPSCFGAADSGASLICRSNGSDLATAICSIGSSMREHLVRVYLEVRLRRPKIEIPVTPELPRSSGNARIWRWCGNRLIRRFYEFYLGAFGSGTLFDVGANDGTHTYPFASHGYDCTCFEPQPRCIAYIERVCQLNGFSNVTIQHCAVGDKDCPGVESHVSSSSWYSSLDRERVERWEAFTPVRVEMISLDSYCRSPAGLNPPSSKSMSKAARLACSREVLTFWRSATGCIHRSYTSSGECKRYLGILF